MTRRGHKFNLYLPDPVYDEICLAAEIGGQTIADLLRDAWEHYAWLAAQFEPGMGLLVTVNGRELAMPRLERLARALAGLAEPAAGE